MRRTASIDSPSAVTDTRSAAKPGRSDWQTIGQLLPYLWPFRWRVLAALAFLVAAKMSNIGVPVVLKHIVDGLTAAGAGASAGTGAVAGASATSAAGATLGAGAVLAVPIALILGYGLLRLSTTIFTELREAVFAKVTQRTVRTVSLKVFEHLHALSLRFHLERQTGGLTRDIERGSRGISSLVSYTLYSILPTIIEIALVMTYLVINYDPWFAWITLAALTLYIVFTVSITEWRTGFRRSMNELDSKANVRAIDSLLNYETVKYFNNEKYESQRYDDSMQRWERAAIKSQTSLSVLNIGQSAIIALAVTFMVWRATVGVVEGRMTLGDLVLVNAFMIQLYIPLNFLGVLYREIKQSLTDMERLFTLLDANREIADSPDAKPLIFRSALAGDAASSGAVGSGAVGPEIRFENVHFAYQKDRPILQGIDFRIAPGTTTAVVGASGAGKSTLSRLLFRFYDVDSGRLTIDGQDIRSLTQASLRTAVGIVPQDTVLFNDTLRYNLAYGRPGASEAQVDQAVRASQLDGFIASLPDGFESPVGERGLKLSGGEKQRVAIARMLLKNPPILILDEATSALDSRNEQAIQGALRLLAARRTTLVIAHRLSTIADADQILVMDQGRIAERGTHESLLAHNGLYAQMWAAQADQTDPADQESLAT
jgi:ATP-binding cassette, subfamily B, heavy metal transporter